MTPDQGRRAHLRAPRRHIPAPTRAVAGACGDAPACARRERRERLAITAGAVALVAGGCGQTGYERAISRRLDVPSHVAFGPSAAPPAHDARDSDTWTPDGTLASYVAHAMRESPALEAAFEDWRAAVYGIARARRWPEPTLSYGVFIRSVETRVGPQRQRFGVRQMLPWPGRLAAAADAAAERARAAERRLEVEALAVRRRVAEAYWRLWLIRRTREIHREQIVLLDGLAATVRARIAVGAASLADLSQVDLSRARLDDEIAGDGARERAASASLRGAVGLPPAVATPTTEPAPAAEVPSATDDEIIRRADDHPGVSVYRTLASASEHDARRARTDGKPEFALAAEYIEIPAPDGSAMPDAGKDAVMVSLSVSLPLWRRSYASDERRARAEAAAARARARDATVRATAAIDAELAMVRDTARRIALHETTLIPQADAAYAAVIGAYQAGAGGTLANALLADQSVLALRLELARASAAHAEAWARLEGAVGEAVERRPAPDRVSAVPGDPAPSGDEPDATRANPGSMQ